MGQRMASTNESLGPRSALLVSRAFAERHGAALDRVERETGHELDRIALPADPGARLSDDACARVQIAFFSPDVFPSHSGSFFSAAHRAPHLRWLQVFNAGVDHPVFQDLLERGVRLTNAAGAAAEPIAQTLIAGLLWLARGFPHSAAAQRRRSWEPPWDRTPPPDLSSQTLLVVGIGGIGSEVARLARALGLRVIGVRRSPARPGDPCGEIHPPEALPGLLPRADWLALCCPLTESTRGLIGARALSLLPEGARILNVSRGAVVDQGAMTRALETGALAGAYLDVFEPEPLPANSPLWSMPHVLVTPHSASASAGNADRQVAIFLRNLDHWARGEPLEHEVASDAR